MLLFGHLGITLAVAWFMESRLKTRIDYKLILLGSIFPDIVDKPIGTAFLNNGRIFGHTLLFIIILVLISLKYKRLIFLSFASALHIAEDETWVEPETLFWPLLGDFPAKEHLSFYEYMNIIISEYTPSLSHVFIFEVVGAIIILAFVFRKLFGNANKY